MNKINPKKLVNSKWTATQPAGREKHFIITEVELNDAGETINCVIEAIVSKRSKAIDWHELKDNQLWLQGWQ